MKITVEGQSIEVLNGHYCWYENKCIHLNNSDIFPRCEIFNEPIDKDGHDKCDACLKACEEAKNEK